MHRLLRSRLAVVLVFGVTLIALATLSEVLQQSDFVSMHAPATLEAHGMLKETHFRQMKKNAIFINTGRGPTVDETALIKALPALVARLATRTRVKRLAFQARYAPCSHSPMAEYCSYSRVWVSLPLAVSKL
jgi:hypothetical protein